MANHEYVGCEFAGWRVGYSIECKVLGLPEPSRDELVEIFCRQFGVPTYLLRDEPEADVPVVVEGSS